jgi:hypothetical protein
VLLLCPETAARASGFSIPENRILGFFGVCLHKNSSGMIEKMGIVARIVKKMAEM